MPKRRKPTQAELNRAVDAVESMVPGKPLSAFERSRVEAAYKKDPARFHVRSALSDIAGPAKGGPSDAHDRQKQKRKKK